MATELVIIGAGGFGREVFDWVRDISRQTASEPSIELLGFLDDGSPDTDLLAGMGATHLGGLDWLKGHPSVRYVIAVGDPALRAKIAQRCQQLGAMPADAIVHPSATVGSLTTLGAGTVVCPQVVVTQNVRVGEHVHVNLAATVGHDAEVGDFVTINPAATVCGNVRVDAGTWVGAGAVLKAAVSVPEQAYVEAGQAVVEDLAK